MSDCRCHAGKICDIHVDEVMGNLNEYGGGLHGGIVGGHLGSPTPEQIDFDIMKEIMSLRQRVADMETAKAFSTGIFDNIVQRLNDAEGKIRVLENTIRGLELNKLRGNG